MGRWSRQELEDAIQNYRETARKAGVTGDWAQWANLFTEDATYYEHQYGRLCGRDAISQWIQAVMKPYPASEMIYFPWTWYVVDEERGWVVAEIMNRMKDPGDGSLHESANITVLHYAGSDLWSYEEDAYESRNFARMLGEWQRVKDRCEKLHGEGRDPRAERHLGRPRD